jgi:pimeloyl-ACP methyl ester carboxylesterase
MRYPKRVHALILPDGAVDLIDLPLSDELLSWIGGTWQAGREEGVDKAKEIWLAGSPLAPALQNPLASEQVRQMVEDYTGWHWQNQDPYVGIEPYRREDLSRITAPTLVILGLLNPPYYHEVAGIQDEYIPNSTLVSMAGVGHALSLEDPGEFNRIILEFLGGLGVPGTDS